MLTLAGFLAPDVVAMAAFPLLVRHVRRLWAVTFGACIVIVSSPWPIPADAPLARFIASISAAVVAIKLIDASMDVQRARGPTWSEFMAFLANPFTHVRRSLVRECRPNWRENALTVLLASTTCAAATALLLAVFRVDWSNSPFPFEHVSKVVALMLTITSALGAAARVWRLGGGTARDFMDKPFVATTPSEF